MMNVGMVGVGCISGIYLKNLHEVFHENIALHYLFLLNILY